MSKIEFYKATSRNKLTSIDASVDSLHSRRSLIIQDGYSTTIWVIHGSSTAKTTRESAKKQIKILLDELKQDYSVVEIDYDNAEEEVKRILAQSAGGPIKPALKTIPQLPNMETKPIKTKPNDDGPIIKEFEIAYFEETDANASENQLNQLLDTLREEAFKSLRGKTSKKMGEKSLQGIYDDIVDLLFS